MQRLLKIINAAVTYSVLGFLVIGAVAGSLTGKPLLLTAVRSSSMEPTLRRGDLVLLWPTGPTSELAVGDIFVFKVDDGALRHAGWVIHRAVGGDPDSGFVTQGDNNATTDQHQGANRLIAPSDVAARTLMLGDAPLRVPFVGFLPLWTERVMEQPAVLAGVALFVLALAFIPQSARRKQKQRRRYLRGRHEYVLYLMGGAVVFVLVAAAGLMLSQQFVYPYAVSATDRAALMGSNIGQLVVGDEVQRTLTTVENKNGRLPLILTVSYRDPQISVHPAGGIVRPGELTDLRLTVTAAEPGQYAARIRVGLFYPVLPPALLHALAKVSYWLALGVVSLVVSLPVLAIPLAERGLRRQLLSDLKQLLRRLRWRTG